MVNSYLIAFNVFLPLKSKMMDIFSCKILNR